MRRSAQDKIAATDARSLSPSRARDLLLSFDRMQTLYIPRREQRFQAMFDLTEARLPRRFRALDLGCGPGPLSLRLLQRFPQARAVAVDWDPLLMEVGRRALPAPLRPRLTWVEADLRRRDWHRSLPPGRFDVVLSTTALHWLTARALGALYRDLFRLLRPGGLFLNGDKAVLDLGEPALRRMTDDAMHRGQRAVGLSPSGNAWSVWWRGVRRERSLDHLYALRQERFPSLGNHGHDIPASLHRRLLLNAGFREADVVWREFTNVIVAAVRSG